VDDTLQPAGLLLDEDADDGPTGPVTFDLATPRPVDPFAGNGADEAPRSCWLSHVEQCHDIPVLWRKSLTKLRLARSTTRRHNSLDLSGCSDGRRDLLDSLGKGL
jgi:hypothetical protein